MPKIKAITDDGTLTDTMKQVFEGNSVGIGTKVETAFLHQALQAPGIPAERTLNKEKLKGLELLKVSDTLYVKVALGTTFKYCAVPMTNVACWVPTLEDAKRIFG